MATLMADLFRETPPTRIPSGWVPECPTGEVPRVPIQRFPPWWASVCSFSRSRKYWMSSSGVIFLSFFSSMPKAAATPAGSFSHSCSKRLCDVGQLMGLGVLQLHAPEVVEEDLVVEIEVALAFHQE